VIREALIVSTGTTLLPEFLPTETRMHTDVAIQPSPAMETIERSAWSELGNFVEAALDSKQPNAYRIALEEFDRIMVSKAMNVTNGHQSMACELLGLSQPTLRSKLRIMFASRQRKEELP